MPKASDLLGKPKIKREFRMMFIDVRTDTETGEPELYLLGDDNEEITRTRNWNEETTKNVLGRTTTTNTITNDTISLDPFYARKGDPMAKLLYQFDLENAELDEIKREYYEAVVDDDSETVYAFKMTADIKLTSVGGSSADADNIPFEISLSGKKTEMEFDFATETFTPKT